MDSRRLLRLLTTSELTDERRLRKHTLKSQIRREEAQSKRQHCYTEENSSWGVRVMTSELVISSIGYIITFISGLILGVTAEVLRFNYQRKKDNWNDLKDQLQDVYAIVRNMHNDSDHAFRIARARLFEEYDVPFVGAIINTVGGSVSVSGNPSTDSISGYPNEYGLALPKLTNDVPTTIDIRSAEMNTTINSVFFSTGNPCLILDFFGFKSVFVKVS